MRPRLLDLFCGAGGAAMGYHRAGFEIIGVDLNPMPDYPFTFIQEDALAFAATYGARYSAIHGSPPCQGYSKTAKLIDSSLYPKLIKPLRKILRPLGVPFVIENVPGAPLRHPVELCGCMFPGLRTYRPRLFETGRWTLEQPQHRTHGARTAKMGRPPAPGEFMHVVGNYSGAVAAQEAMGIDWMRRSEMAEAIPPAYTQFIGHQLIKQV
jgi:DNA (cytosine-5)-methyltransferase 1